MKIALLAFAVIFLSASTFAENSPDLTTSTSNSSDSTVVSSISPTETPSTSPTITSTSSPSSEPTTTSSPSSETTSSSPETTTSSSPETTTSSSPEPTTTSTPAPETTTPHDTTSVAPTSSIEPPTPSPVPPIPTPEPGYWNVTEGNTTCIRANLAIRFKIFKPKGIDYILLSPTASSALSKCNTSDGTELLSLKDSDYSVDFVFEKKSDNVYVRNISFTYYSGSSETFTNDSHFFEVKAGNSYLCKTSSDVILGNATMQIVSIQIQAFGAEHNKDFGSAEECGADSPINDIVPIAVGVALLALVVVVLIAYLVGRRRSRQKGYQSV